MAHSRRDSAPSFGGWGASSRPLDHRQSGLGFDAVGPECNQADTFGFSVLGDPQKQLLQFFRTPVDRAVPFRMERVAADVESLDFGVGGLDALFIGPLNERTSDGCGPP
jgi:hypothetical protein